MYQVSFENIECFLSYEVRLKFCNEADDVANGIPIAQTYVECKMHDIDI